MVPNNMAKIVHKDYNQNDSLLLPPSLGELISSSHPVRIASGILDKFDISDIEATYKGGGTLANLALLLRTNSLS